MTSSGKLFWLNTLSFGCYGLILLQGSMAGTSSTAPLVGILFLFIAFPLFGANAVFLLARVFKQTFDYLEYLCLSLAIAMVLPPLLLTLETASGILVPELPLLNTALLFLATLWMRLPTVAHITPPKNHSINVLPTVLIATFVYVVFLFAIVTAYPFLPDSDPYYWLLKVRGEVEQLSLPTLQLYRPLFSSFVYIVHQTGGFDLTTIFKYILPFLFILVLFPLALIARLFPSRMTQLVLFFIPFSSASFLLYSTMPIPQSILNIVLTYFVCLLLHAYFSKNVFFYFFAGILLLPMYFYHEAAILIFIVWLIITILFYKRHIRTSFSSNPLLWILMLVCVLSNMEHISLLMGFIKNWLVRMVQAVTVWQTNFSFPLAYVNVDGRSVGWGNSMGILKYYAFYAGPAVLLALGAYLVSFRRTFATVRHAQSISRELWVFGLCSALFLTLAEILPRILSVAFLPERSWGFAGLFILAFIPILIRKSSPIAARIISILFLGALCINALAALHINNLKQHLLSPLTIPATQWIAHELPPQSVLITQVDASVLRVFTPLSVIDAQNPGFYSDLSVFNTLYNEQVTPLCRAPNSDNTDKIFSQLTQSLDFLKQYYPSSNATLLQSAVDSMSDQIDLLRHQALIPQTPVTTCRVPTPQFIYFAKRNPNNPYADRPYSSKVSAELDASIVFDQHPNRFQRVYTTDKDEIIIWKVLQ